MRMLPNADVYWNPWHGCRKVSEGCKNCYVYFLDRRYGRDASVIFRTKTVFNLPITRTREGVFKHPKGTTFMTCFNSDFFLEDADPWRPEAWDIMRQRQDCAFFLMTKRPERIAQNFPEDREHFQHLMIGVSTENQAAADRRLPGFLSFDLPYHGIMVGPILETVDLRPYLATGKVNQVTVSGESYEGARVTRYDDVRSIYLQCKEFNVPFHFLQTGNLWFQDGEIHHVARAKQRSLAKTIVFE